MNKVDVKNLNTILEWRELKRKVKAGPIIADGVLKAAREKAYGINFSGFPNAPEVYIRGFADGQYWKSQQSK